MRRLFRWLGRSALALLTALLLVGLGVWLHFIWSGPELGPWHKARLDAEFVADDYASGRVTTLAQYRELERRLMEQVQKDVVDRLEPAQRVPFNRFNAGSLSDPASWPVNWNHTYVLEPSGDPVGGVLLLHGLTDSPYSLRSVGEALVARGFRVVGLRLPGHGTAPAGLLTFEPEDLQAATEIAMKDLRGTLGPDRPLHVMGYSNGAALAVQYGLDARENAALPQPASLVLISPAIGITRLAAIGRLRTGISDLQGFGRAAWQLIDHELDPYKYQSFSFHAAGATQRLTSQLASRIERLAEAGPLTGMPPILAFVSTVDSTVIAGAVSDQLLGRLAAAGHELVLFDVNRLSIVQPLLVSDPGPLTRRLVEQPQRPYALTLVTNESPQTLAVIERRFGSSGTAPDERALGLEWPRNVFSLSHVALPFPPDDPLYGYEAPPAQHIQLGRIEVRGENGVLRIPAWMLTRQRSNPFHGYMLERILQHVGAPAAPQAAVEPAA
jgi:alpha-beta hydrolase superfamily lysophospholipase